MATWYVDYEGGIDANASAGNGDSFATRRKRIDNIVAAALNPGDEVRIMASPNPTLLGNATWTGGPLPASVPATSFSNETPIKISFPAGGTLSTTLSTGDTIIVSGVAGNTNANGVWVVANKTETNLQLLNPDGSPSVGNGVGTTGNVRKFTNAVVTLAAPVTQNIALCGNRGQKPNWTASANVTCTITPSDFKEGAVCLEILFADSFTTGKAAYYTLPSPLNLSGYQQISFWVKAYTAGAFTDGMLTVNLCSDTIGNVPVDTFSVPGTGAVNQWMPVVVDKASALGASIQSIAIYATSDPGTRGVRFDNIIACKASSAADSLNLTSLISKDPGDHSYGDGYECWFGIQSINGTRVVLDGTVNSIPGSSPQRGYSGTTETVATYKRETIKTVPLSSSGSVVQTIQDSGSAGNLVSFTGGWNRTDMSTQTGETWFDGQNGFGSGLYQASKPWVSFDKVNGTRYSTFYNPNGASDDDLFIGLMQVCNTSGAPIAKSGSRLTATTLSAVCCGGAIQPGTAAKVTTIGRADSTTSGIGVTLGAGSWTGTIKSACNNTNSGVQAGIAGYIESIEKVSGNQSGYFPADYSIVKNLISENNTQYGIIQPSNKFGWSVLGGYTSGNSLGGVQVASCKGALRNFTINESTEASGFTSYNDGRVYSEKHDGTAGNNRIFCDGGLISTDSTVTHGTASYSWKFSPTSTNRSEYYPLNQAIAQIAVGASALVTVKAWLRRDNTGLTGRLVCKGGQLAGVASDVVATMTAGANTWQEQTITFTPSESGVIEVEAQFYGGTTFNGWCSDLTVSQA